MKRPLEFLSPSHAEAWLSSGIPGLTEMQVRYGLTGSLFESAWGLSDGGRAAGRTKRLVEDLAGMLSARSVFIQDVSFAVPCQEAIAAIASEGAVLEGGAGTGYWAALLANLGCDIIACDPSEISRYGQKIGRYHPIVQVSAQKAIDLYPDRNLLLVWPSYGEEWATEAARLLASGRLLFLVSEGRSGAVASNSLFDLLDKSYAYVGEIVIPQWCGIHDFLAIYRRR